MLSNIPAQHTLRTGRKKSQSSLLSLLSPSFLHIFHESHALLGGGNVPRLFLETGPQPHPSGFRGCFKGRIIDGRASGSFRGAPRQRERVFAGSASVPFPAVSKNTLRSPRSARTPESSLARSCFVAECDGGMKIICYARFASSCDGSASCAGGRRRDPGRFGVNRRSDSTRMKVFTVLIGSLLAVVEATATFLGST